MSVRIRLMRMGKRHQPSYRVVVADSRSPRDGKFIEVIGRYDPKPDPSVVEIDNEKALKWLRVGAQPSESVINLLEITGVADAFESERPGSSFKQARRKKKEAAKARAAKKPKPPKSAPPAPEAVQPTQNEAEEPGPDADAGDTNGEESE